MLCFPGGNHGIVVGIWCRLEIKISYRSLLSNDFRIIKIFSVIFRNDLTGFRVCFLIFHIKNLPGQLFLWSMRNFKLLITSEHKELVLTRQLSNVQSQKPEYTAGQEGFSPALQKCWLSSLLFRVNCLEPRLEDILSRLMHYNIYKNILQCSKLVCSATLLGQGSNAMWCLPCFSRPDTRFLPDLPSEALSSVPDPSMLPSQKFSKELQSARVLSFRNLCSPLWIWRRASLACPQPPASLCPQCRCFGCVREWRAEWLPYSHISSTDRSTAEFTSRKASKYPCHNNHCRWNTSSTAGTAINTWVCFSHFVQFF